MAETSLAGDYEFRFPIAHGKPMSETAIIILIIAAVPVLWFLIKVIVGGSASKSFSGRAYLRQLLQKQGFRREELSDECVNELVESSKQHAEMMSYINNESHTKNFVENLEGLANTIGLYRADPDFPRAEHIMEVLQKHHVRL